VQARSVLECVLAHGECDAILCAALNAGAHPDTVLAEQTLRSVIDKESTLNAYAIVAASDAGSVAQRIAQTALGAWCNVTNV
jgi:hypothetical protein